MMGQVGFCGEGGARDLRAAFWSTLIAGADWQVSLEKSVRKARAVT